MGILEFTVRTPTHLLNFLTFGSIKHSFSARVGKASFEHNKRWAMIAETQINKMAVYFFGHYDHCYKEYINEFKH